MKVVRSSTEKIVEVPVLHIQKESADVLVARPVRRCTHAVEQKGASASRAAWPISGEDSDGAWAVHQRSNRGTNGGSPRALNEANICGARAPDPERTAEGSKSIQRNAFRTT